MSHEIKIVIPSRAWRRGSPMDLQEPLDEALSGAGLGEVVRGGAAPGHFFLVAEVTDVQLATACIQECLLGLDAPDSIAIQQL
jgi:hypothetical protein